MSKPVSNAEIEDVLSSIRRLVSENSSAGRRNTDSAAARGRFVLTPALRVAEPAPEAAEASGEVIALDTGADTAPPKPEHAPLVLDQAMSPAEIAGEPQVWQDAPDDEVEAITAALAEALAETEPQDRADHTPEAQDDAEAWDRAAEDGVTEDGATEDRGPEDRGLEARLAELEAAIDRSADDWEPDGSEPQSLPDSIPTFTHHDRSAAPEAQAPDEIETIDWVSPEQEAAEAEAAREAEHLEAERLEAARQEAERIEAERREAERLEAERQEAERQEAERAEAERLEAARAEAERREAERLEAERLEAERAEAERQEAERQEAERAEAERAEAERREAERQHAERAEAERREAERLAQQGADYDEPATDWEDVDTLSQSAGPHPGFAQVEAEAHHVGADYAEDDLLDEAALRDLVARIVREELQGPVGERITHNIRRLVRREIARALSLRDFD